MLSTDFVLAMLTALHRHNLMQRIGIVTSCRLAACFITFYAKPALRRNGSDAELGKMDEIGRNGQCN